MLTDFCILHCQHGTSKVFKLLRLSLSPLSHLRCPSFSTGCDKFNLKYGSIWYWNWMSNNCRIIAADGSECKFNLPPLAPFSSPLKLLLRLIRLHPRLCTLCLKIYGCWFLSALSFPFTGFRVKLICIWIHFGMEIKAALMRLIQIYRLAIGTKSFIAFMSMRSLDEIPMTVGCVDGNSGHDTESGFVWIPRHVLLIQALIGSLLSCGWMKCQTSFDEFKGETLKSWPQKLDWSSRVDFTRTPHLTNIIPEFSLPQLQPETDKKNLNHPSARCNKSRDKSRLKLFSSRFVWNLFWKPERSKATP